MPPVPQAFQNINRFVVLMLENRSFDHLVGYQKTINPAIAGITGHEFSNLPDPNNSASIPVPIDTATRYAMPFDPHHEFADVEFQLFGPSRANPSNPNAPTSPAPMNGFLFNALQQAQQPLASAQLVMQCFQPAQLPVLSALIQQFALFNFWYSSLPGPTWPNRFFVHAATSGGLTDSPSDAQIALGYSFPKGTIYESLGNAGKEWRIYHDGLPQPAGIDSIRLAYVDPFTRHFREMSNFAADVQQGLLPDYTFIEPNYDTGNNYQCGNSMHPLNDIRKGESLVKDVYETLRNSAYWSDTMLIVTFDEHGGFFDHVSPPPTVPTGDDDRYKDPQFPFAFDRLGIRVPALVISAYTGAGTVIGSDLKDPSTIFDHSSVLATVEKRFGLAPLTARDAAAKSLDVALNLAAPRLSASDAPPTLPPPAPDSAVASPPQAMTTLASAARDNAPLSDNQKSFLALALACDLKTTPSAGHDALHKNFAQIHTQKNAADYIKSVETKIHSRRTKHLPRIKP